MVCIDNISCFFDNNPNFEYARNVSLALAREFGHSSGMVDDIALPWIFGDLELAFRYDMDKDLGQIRVLARFFEEHERTMQ